MDWVGMLHTILFLMVVHFLMGFLGLGPYRRPQRPYRRTEGEVGSESGQGDLNRSGRAVDEPQRIPHGPWSVD